MSLVANDDVDVAFVRAHEELMAEAAPADVTILAFLATYAFTDDRFARAIAAKDESFYTLIVRVARMLSSDFSAPAFFDALGDSDAAQTLFIEVVRHATASQSHYDARRSIVSVT